MNPSEHASFAERLEVIHERIRNAGGDPHRTTLVAVTKGFGPEAASLALSSGICDLGENYAQEMLAKQRALSEGFQSKENQARWHYLGRIQRNKVALLAGKVFCYQGLAREAEAEEIAKRDPGAMVLVEVDFTGDPHRPGCPPTQVSGLVQSALDKGLQVAGLMTVAPLGTSQEKVQAFRSLARLADSLSLPVRSMGMTDDLELAVAEGSTMVRIGRGLFGDRPTGAPDRS